MNNTDILLKYMLDRGQNKPIELKKQGPVITISRQFGCGARSIAERLSKKITDYSTAKNGKEWKWINKEIVENTAKKLNMKPELIEEMFHSAEKNVLGDIVVSFSSKKYAGSTKIKKTITRIIEEYVDEGNIIIVGRGGHAITKYLKKALHIRIEAPIEWRAQKVSERYKVSTETARENCYEMDKKRDLFNQYFTSNTEAKAIFDVTFNAKTLTKDMIVDSIFELAKIKQLI